MIRCSRIMVLLSLTALLTGTPTPGGQDRQNSSGVTIISRTNFVLVPAVVEDGSGKHITGLTKDSFEIVENGKKKAIATFEEIRTTPRPIERAPNQRGTFTNALAGDASAKRLTIYALDTVNTPFLDQAYARQQLIKFLANRVSGDEPCALISIQGNGIRILHDFSSDPAVLVAALRKVVGQSSGLTLSGQELEQSQGTPLGISPEEQRLFPGNGSPALKQQVKAEFETQTAAIDSFVSGADVAYAVSAQRNNILATLEAFQHVAEAFAGVPGRKSLVWATASFPFGLDPTTGTLLSPNVFNQGQAVSVNTMTSTGALPELPSSTQVRASEDLRPLAPIYERTIQMLNDANISLYPVDARGLVTFFPDASTSRMAGLPSFNQALFESSRQTMVGFAEMTGGKAFYNRNDLDVAFAKAADDSASYYMLGYYLDKDPKPGWHKLQVKAKQGGHVRARNGFFVTPESRQSDTRRMDIKMALASPLDYTALPLRVGWTGVEQAGAKKKVSFEVALPPGAGVVDESDRNHLNLEIVALARKPDGEPADQVAEHIETNLKPESMSALHKDGVNYNSNLQVPPGEYIVRFIVRDNLTGRVGSVRAPLRVAP
jgi:VWFA-related protein